MLFCYGFISLNSLTFHRVCLCVGLSLENATNIPTLTAELDKVTRQLHELTVSSRTRYAPKQHRDELRSQLDSCVMQKDKIESEVDGLRWQEAVMRTAVDAAQSYLQIQLPHQTVGDAVVLALSSQSLSGMSHSVVCQELSCIVVWRIIGGYNHQFILLSSVVLSNWQVYTIQAS